MWQGRDGKPGVRPSAYDSYDDWKATARANFVEPVIEPRRDFRGGGGGYRGGGGGGYRDDRRDDRRDDYRRDDRRDDYRRDDRYGSSSRR